MITFYVTLSAQEALERLRQEVLRAMSAEQLDHHQMNTPEGRSCTVAIYEKYYYRVGNRLTLTATVDDLSGRTRVHLVGGGGGTGAFFSFDWGAEGSFVEAAYQALKAYEI